MISQLLTVAAIVLSGPPITETTEYVLQIEERGYIDRRSGDEPNELGVPDKKPRGNVLNFMEIDISPRRPFRMKTSHGNETREFRGELKSIANGMHSIDVLYSTTRILATSATLPQPDVAEPLYDRTTAKTSIEIPLDKPLCMGGMITKSETTTTTGTALKESNVAFWVTLRKKAE